MFGAVVEIVDHQILPQNFDDPNAPDGVLVKDQLVLTGKAIGDEKTYQFNYTVDDKTPSEQQLDEWQEQGIRVMVFISGIRSTPFVQDPNAKNPDGTPKRYPTQGKALTQGKATMSVGVVHSCTAYAIQPAGQVDLKTESDHAHGMFLKNSTLLKKRNHQRKLDAATAKIEERKKANKNKKIA